MAFGEKTTAAEIATAYQDSIRGKNGKTVSFGSGCSFVVLTLCTCVVVITGVSPNSLGAADVEALAPYAKTIIVASRSVERYETLLRKLTQGLLLTVFPSELRNPFPKHAKQPLQLISVQCPSTSRRVLPFVMLRRRFLALSSLFMWETYIPERPRGGTRLTFASCYLGPYQ